MPEIIRTRRYRDNDYDSFSDDDRRQTRTTEIRTSRASDSGRDGGRDGRDNGGRYQTVQRYRIARSPSPDRGSHRARSQDREVTRDVRVERTLEVDAPARPRSYVDYRETRERDDDLRSFRGGDRERERDVREVVYERQVEREPAPEPVRERQRTVVYERDSPRASERDVRYWERPVERDWERENITDTQVVVSRTRERSPSPRYEREREKQVIIERRRERSPSPKYEMVTRETEYYARPDPPPQPLVIRQQMAEPQKIYVEAAQPQPPVIIKQPQYEVVHRQEIIDNRQELVRQEPRTQEVVYRRHEIRDSSSPEDDYLSERRYVRREGDWSDGEYEDDHRYRRQGPAEDRYRRRRSRSRSVESDHHKRHLAEGAAAGAAAGAILAHHRSKSRRGDGRGGKAGQVVGGAALGAIGAQIATKVNERLERRKSRERYDDYDDRRGRRRSASESRFGKKEKVGLGAALLGAALIGGKIIKDRNDAKKAEEGRGRSRTRSRSKVSGASADHRHLSPKHRKNSVARNAAIGAAALAVGQQIQKHRSKSRGKKGRSKSKRRTGAELAGAALVTAAATSLYEKRKAKAEAKEEDMGIPPLVAARGVSRSRSRSRARSVYSDYNGDGLVEYGDEPLAARREKSYVESSHKEPLMLREKSRTRVGAKADYWDDRHSRSRSRSKVRDAITGAAAATAAAVGVKKYRDRQRRSEAEMDSRGRSHDRRSSSSPDHYYDRHERDYSSDSFTHSPVRASGGAGYPAQAPFPAPPVAGAAPGTFHQQTTTTTTAPAPADPYMSGGAGPALGGQNPNYYDDRARGDNVSADHLDRGLDPTSSTTKPHSSTSSAPIIAAAAAVPLTAAVITRSRSLSPSPASPSPRSSTSASTPAFTSVPLHPSLRNLASPALAESAAIQHQHQHQHCERRRRRVSPAKKEYLVDDRGRPYEDTVEADGTVHRHYHRRPRLRTPTPPLPSSSSSSTSSLSLSPPRPRRHQQRHLSPFPPTAAEYGTGPISLRPPLGRRRATSLAPDLDVDSPRRRRRSSPMRARSQSQGPTNKSVAFAPLSPMSSMALALVKGRKESADVSPDRDAVVDRELEDKRRRYEPSETSESGTDVEEVPRRFDGRGRPVYDDGDDEGEGEGGYERGRRREHRLRGRKRTSGGVVEGAGEADQVTEIMKRVVGVLEGKGDWKEVFRGVVEAAAGGLGDVAGGEAGGSGGGKKRRR